MQDEGLSSSYILIEEGEKEAPHEGSRKRKCAGVEEEKYVTILTPRKENTRIFLTPVKRSKRTVINGLKAGSIRVHDDSMEVLGGGSYLSLVECFKKLESLDREERRERRGSIDAIVRRHLK